MSYSTQTYPFDTVVYISTLISGTWWQASGVLVSPDEVLTASHVVYRQGVGAATSITVIPAFDGVTNPYGTFSGSTFHYYEVEDANDLISNAQSQSDVAIIHLSAPVTGAGYMGIEAGYAGGIANITGYPASEGGIQETESGNVYRDPGYTLLDGTPLGKGSSGGPVWIQTASGPYVVGVVSSSDGSLGYNTLITPTLFNQIEDWIRQDDSPAPPPSSVPSMNFEVNDFADGTTVRDVVSGAVISQYASVGNSPNQFLNLDGIKYGRNIASAMSLGLDPGKLRDYDGNDLGASGGWEMKGLANVRLGEDPSYILANPVNGRWAEVQARSDGSFAFSDHGQNGHTRVVGIYEDPLIKLGVVVKGSPVDSQTRFQNDLRADRLAVLGGADFDHDGFVDLFFKLLDHKADHSDDVYLRAIMHADGNIQYANYMNSTQFNDFMTKNGVASDVYGDWTTRI